MKTILVICCIFAMSDALSLVIPPKDYPTKFDFGEVHPLPIIDLVSDEEQLLSSRVGRQYYSQKGQPTTQQYDEYYVKGYNNNYYLDYPNQPNRRNSFQMQRRRRFGGIGSAIIV